MKDNWERAEAPAALDLQEINGLTGSVFSRKRVIAAERIGIGFSNSNYKIRFDGIKEPYVLRLYRSGAEIAKKELAISRLLGGSLPVPNIIFADLSCTVYPKPWAVMEWKEGVLLRDILRSGGAEAVASAAASVGRTLAGIHSNTFPAAGFFGKNLSIAHAFTMDSGNFTAFIEESLYKKPCGYWLGEELKNALWTFCKQYAPLLSVRYETPVLVHSDFNGLNVLMHDTPPYAVSAVLDWEFAFSGSRLADIANMLRYEEEGSPFERHFISSYLQAGGTLPGNWKLLSKLEDLIALCDMLNSSTEKTPNRISDLKRLVAKTVLEYS